MPSISDLEVVITANTKDAESGILGIHEKISGLGAMAGGALSSVVSGLGAIGLASIGIKAVGDTLVGLGNALG